MLRSFCRAPLALSLDTPVIHPPRERADDRPDPGVVPVPAWRLALQVGLAVAGIAGVAWIVVDAGPARMLAALGAAVTVFPLVLVLEGLRVVADALLTRQLLGTSASHVPLGALLRAQLVAYPAATLLPAGRTAGEAIKAILLRRHVGIERAAAAAVIAPAIALYGTAVVSIPCILAVYAIIGWSTFTGAVVLQAVTAVALGTLLVVATRRRELGRAIARVSRRFGVAATAVQDVIRDEPPIRPSALLAAVANRAAMVLQILIVAAATGAAGSLVYGLAVAGAHFVGAAAGEMVPGQLGATDAAQALVADDLGTARAAAVAVALVLHAAQLCWVVVGSVAAMSGRRGR
jgi:lysylphosphatidylglycerol synthase-like protein